MKPTPISIRDKVQRLFSASTSYNLFIHISNKDVYQENSEKDGFLGVIFPLGCVKTFDEAKNLQEYFSIETGAPVTIVKSGVHFPLYISNQKETTTYYKYDPTDQIENIKKEIEKQKARRDESKQNNLVSKTNSENDKLIKEIEKKVKSLENNSSLQSEERNILRLHYFEELATLRTKLKNVDINNEIIERGDKSTLSYIINQIYNYSATNEMMANAQTQKAQMKEEIDKHFRLYPEHLSTWQSEAEKRFQERGEQDVYDCILKNYVSEM